jgi:hypothetical protein
MYYTLVGRLQTRLCALTGPLMLMSASALLARSAGPLRLFALMAVLGILLDVGLYHWLIRYQPPWLTIALGVGEFVLLLGLLHGPAWMSTGLRPATALVLYTPGWLLSWLTTQVLLPWRWPRWAEDGGELRPGGLRRR